MRLTAFLQNIAHHGEAHPTKTYSVSEEEFNKIMAGNQAQSTILGLPATTFWLLVVIVYLAASLGLLAWFKKTNRRPLWAAFIPFYSIQVLMTEPPQQPVPVNPYEQTSLTSNVTYGAQPQDVPPQTEPVPPPIENNGGSDDGTVHTL